MRYRSRTDIISKILDTANGGGATKTKLMYQAFLSFTQVKTYLQALTAFVDNIPFAATMIPLVSTLSQNESISAAFGGFAINPIWWALALGSGLGGNGTVIGSSAGIIAVGLAEKQGYNITFNRFLKVGFPFMILTTAIASIVLAIGIFVSM